MDATLARLAAQLVERSRASLGADGLAKATGNGTPVALLAELGNISRTESARLCRVGEATNPRLSFLGEQLPPAYPAVAQALDRGQLPLESAHCILSNLQQALPRADQHDLVVAEDALVDFAITHPTDVVRTLAIRWRDALDTDGVEPREAALIERRALRRTNLANGMRRYLLDLDPLGAGYLDTAIDALLGAALRAPRFETAAADPQSGEPGEAGEVRTIAQIGADAIVDLARHNLGCQNSTTPLPTTTLVVRIPLSTLQNGIGVARLDGIEQPISASTARRLAAEAEIVPIVLGGASEVLDLGASRRLFNRAQRLAFAERDGGCAWANCPRPPSHTEAHHLRWWSHGGQTNLDNGILLCTMHHHRIHRDGWGIRVEGAIPWFIPPPSIDPHRRPRRGGRLPEPTLNPP